MLGLEIVERGLSVLSLTVSLLQSVYLHTKSPLFRVEILDACYLLTLRS